MDKFFFEAKQLVVKVLRCLFLYLDYGQKCLVCSKWTFYIPVCSLCREKFYSLENFILKERCEICGSVLVSSKRTCLECRKEVVLKHTDAVYSMFSYRLWNKELMFKWKIQNERSLSEFFAAKMYEALKMLGCEVVVPVPARKGKIKEKGWDQINDLCKFLKYRYGLYIFDILERISSEQQKKMTRQQRLGQISMAYNIASESKVKRSLKKLKGTFPLKVCIIDDVRTTGSTIECCAKLLKDFGIEKVYALTLFGVG